MEILAQFGTPLQQEQWLAAAARRRDPLVLRDDRAVGRQLRRHQHLEPHRARRRRLRDQRAQVVHERRGSTRCKFAILMGVSDPDADRTAATRWSSSRWTRPGVTDRARRSRCSATPRAAATARRCWRTCACPKENLLGEEGGGFAIAQARLGPGRIHHCMRAIGMAEQRARADVHARAEAGRVRQAARRPGRRPGARSPSRASQIEQARLLTMKAAWMMDTVGKKGARIEIARDQGGRGAPRDRR